MIMMTYFSFNCASCAITSEETGIINSQTIKTSATITINQSSEQTKQNPAQAGLLFLMTIARKLYSFAHKIMTGKFHHMFTIMGN